MSAASNFLENAVIESTLRGAAFPTITKVYVALHTNNPTDAGGNEVTSALWPSYARQDAAKGGSISSGWTAAADGVSKNALQLIFPVFDGSADLTVTHFSLYDAATGDRRQYAGSRTIAGPAYRAEWRRFRSRHTKADRPVFVT